MAFSRFRSLSLIFVTCLLAYPAAAKRQFPLLPQSAPVPEMLSERPDLLDTPLPQARPEAPPEPASAPQTAPPPEVKTPEGASGKSGGAETKPPSPQPDPRSKTVAAEKMPAEEEACRARLRAMGIAFEERPAKQNTEVGCSMPYPLSVSGLAKGIELTPEAELNCTTAEAIARFTADVVQPAATNIMGTKLSGVIHASAYVCRPRHNGGKLSEHAFGNALDIASFTFTDGSRIDVAPQPDEKQGKFLDHVREAACGPFKTVLGPGSDPDHETHLHLDLAPRRNGSTFCQ